MPSPALQQLLDLQRSMYDRALTEARECCGADSDSILKYQQEFEASLPNDFSTIPARKLMEAMDRSRVILFGDFHSHKQTQRAFLRALRMYQNRPDHAPIAVCLEMFKSKDQQHVNAWMSGHTTDQHLHEAINYESTWGFPWNNYRPILDYCKQENIPVIGINTSKGGKDPLAKRDAHCAGIIQRILKKNTSLKVLCMIGEFHLADRHLPSALTSLPKNVLETPPLRIFANLDKYYFAIRPDKLDGRDEYLELNRSTYCVINSPPWIKWHSQSLWEEMRRIGSVKYLENSLASDDSAQDIDGWEDDDESLYDDETIDIDYHLRHFQSKILEFLNIKAPGSLLERFCVVHGELETELSHMPAAARTAFLLRASADGFAVDYSGRLVYIPEISVNNMSAAAGQMLFGSISQASETYTDTELLFTAQCLKYTFGYIANKILNPRKPLQGIKQVEAYILQSRGKRLIGLMRQRRQVAQATLNIHAWISENWQVKAPQSAELRRIPAPWTRLDQATSHELCRSLAQLIAEPICRGLLRGKVDTVDLQKWLQRDCKNIKAAKETLAAMITMSSA